MGRSIRAIDLSGPFRGSEAVAGSCAGCCPRAATAASSGPVVPRNSQTRAKSLPPSPGCECAWCSTAYAQPQYWIEDSRGRLACADLAFPEQQVAVEYDGAWRNGQLWALNHDRDRLNRVQAAGWEVVFVTAPS